MVLPTSLELHVKRKFLDGGTQLRLRGFDNRLRQQHEQERSMASGAVMQIFGGG
jgi:hypothetical protein